MSSFALTQIINRLTKEIADLRVADSKEANKETLVQSRINRANDTLYRTTNRSMIQSKQREIERGLNNLARIQAKRAGLTKKIDNKSTQLSRYESQRNSEVERKRKQVADGHNHLLQEREQHERRITSGTQSRKHMMIAKHHSGTVESKDFFISHASEDKDSFVKELATSLKNAGVCLV